MALQKVYFYWFFLNLHNVATIALELSTDTLCVHIIAGNHTHTHIHTLINIYTGLHLLSLICYARSEDEEGKKHLQVAKGSKSPAKEPTLKRAEDCGG